MLSSAPLSSNIYNNLPQANDQTPPEQRILQSVGELFIKHNVHGSFGVALLHKHFDMAEHEIMVHKGLICSPEITTASANEDLSGRSFFLSDGRFQAYEYQDGSAQGDDLPPAFLDALRAHLVRNELSQILALTRIVAHAPPLMEHCGAGRTHVCDVAEQTILPAEATEWKFDVRDGSSAVFVMRACKRDRKGNHKNS
ncbi:hypothetical protein K461DRAFT_165877 [Myriangium duriaei CBS 260.36]|uniref:Uncharacterized protein n=1 Tax=Myriangium duriaei CBS 260.36 TaxID=1168546 RepID=A0A9P4MEE0_9PEZI|nr:hypothetical protein K461DRAFT_165877 [Myriangium duriaei CBS 260.36]